MKIRSFHQTEPMSTLPQVVFDIECDGIEATLMHCLAHDGAGKPRATSKMSAAKSFITNDKQILIGHKIASYDIPTVERLLDCKVDAVIIDTLYLSWYLYPNRLIHGLDAWGEELGVAKPKITDWEGLEPAEYRHRCMQDVKINRLLWKKQWKDLMRLYSNDEDAVWRLIRYLSFKATSVSIQETNRWKLNVGKANSFIEKVQPKYDANYNTVKAALPPVPIKKKKKYPAKPYKANGDMSANGIKWFELLDELGLPEDHKDEITFIDGYKEANAGSPVQVKEWLFSIGWKPCTFEYKGYGEDKRAIPQVRTKDDDGMAILTKSIIALIKDNPAVAALEQMGVEKHRLDIVKGFLRNMNEDGFVKASMNSLTPTLRLKHAEIVNLPGVDKPHGEDIRGMLEAREGNILLGSDQSALEDVTKNHYIYKYDPQYVKDQEAEGFCPHVDIAFLAGYLDKEQVERHMTNNFIDAADKAFIKGQRKKAKPVNYGALYGIQAQGLSDATGMYLDEAQKVIDAYWGRNWAVKQVAEDALVKDIAGQLWLWNPVAELWYSLRNKKDIFSTLNQGTGTYCFDLWKYHILRRRPQLNGEYHDEVILEIKDTQKNRVKLEELIYTALDNTNDELKLNKELGIDHSWGNTYADIH